MASKAREDMQGDDTAVRIGAHPALPYLRRMRVGLAGVCLLALASCSATSDPLLRLGIAPEQLAQSETSDTDAEAPEVAVSQDDGAAKTVASTSSDESEPDETATVMAENDDSDPAFAQAGASDQAVADRTKVAAASTDADTMTDTADSVELANETAAAPDTAKDAKTGKRRNFLSAFFSPSPNRANAATRAIDETTTPQQPKAAATEAGEPEKGVEAAEDDTREEPAKPIVELASTEPSSGPLFGADALPGVRGGDSLFEISHKSGIDDDSTIDVYEDVGSYQVASAGGMARLAPNGLLVQREGVNVGCFKPNLVRTLKTIERHYGKRLVVTSGYRSPSHNRRVNGARHSLHMSCAAADIQMAGVSKWELAKFARSLPGRGGVGTYCHTNSIHVDVGPQRDWNWRCSRRRK